MAQLCTVSQVKVRLFPNGVTDTADDAMIQEMIDQVSLWIEGYTARPSLGPDNNKTYRMDGAGGQVLYIPRGIRTLTTVKLADSHQPDTGGTFTTYATTNFLLRPTVVNSTAHWPFTEIWISRASTDLSRWPAYQNSIEITGDWGFAGVPDDLEAVCIDAVVAAYSSRRNGASSVLGADATALPPWSQFFGRGSPQRGTLDRYRYYPV